MLRILRTDSSNEDFKMLVNQLDEELAQIDGDEHAFYHQFNAIDQLKHCLVGYLNETPVACGAIKPLNENGMEVKRMYTVTSARNMGFASKLLSDLEVWAKELGIQCCVLETGKRQKDAIALYLKSGYELIPNYGQYQGIENSVCFRKSLR